MKIKTLSAITFFFTIISFAIGTHDHAGDFSDKEVKINSKKEFVIIAEGQSNMTATDPNIVPFDIKPNKNVFIWNNSKSNWEILKPNYDNIYFHFARKYQETYGGVVKIILNALGGKPIEEWIKKGSVDRHQMLVDQIQASGITKVNVHLWHQGESNSQDPNYIFKLNARLDLLESLPQYEKDKYFFLFGEIVHDYPVYKIWRAAALCYENVISRKYVAYVRSEGLNTVKSGPGINVHFDGVDLYKFGQRYFDVYQNMSLGQNLQVGGSFEIQNQNSDLWDLTKDTFILPSNSPLNTLVLPRNFYNKKFKITNLKETPVTLLPYSGNISGKSSYLLKKKSTIEFKGYSNGDGTAEAYQIINISE